MVGAQQPWMYNADQSSDSRFPATTFDPKAVTRASWEPKPRPPPQNGPLVSFNRHPDAQMVLSYRAHDYASMSPLTKSCIKWMRRIQVLLRLLELTGAIGMLVLFILFTDIDAVTCWVMRIALGFVIAHCIYAVYHLARDAAGRTPASSAAYQAFAAALDLGTMGLYGFGGLNVHNKADGWSTRLSDQTLVHIFVPAVYYTLIGAGCLHFVSFSVSLWLGSTFRKISLMPPDMNPLEDHLTARPKHMRNKSSVTTMSATESEKRLSTPLEDRRRSGMPYENISRPPSVPFMHTRTQSRDSWSTRDSRLDLPSRQYHAVGGTPPRSAGSIESGRMSVPRSSYRGSYIEVPLHDTGSSRRDIESPSSGQHRPPKFTENWMPTDSLISRTNQRHRSEAVANARRQLHSSNSYSAIVQPYNADDSSDSEYDDENAIGRQLETDASNGSHPNPLRSHPLASDDAPQRATPPRKQTPFRPWSTQSALQGNSLAAISSNEMRVDAARDIADEPQTLGKPWQRSTAESLQADFGFYSRPYGELKSATPPIMVGNNRKISSGNDYEAKYTAGAFGRRNVSGKIAEEGRAGTRASQLSLVAPSN